MPRRRIIVMLVLLAAVQLLGSMALASECQEPCPDDTETSSCPPVCALCTICTHAQPGLVPQAVTPMPGMTVQHLVPQGVSSVRSLRAADIFHVPLRA